MARLLYPSDGRLADYKDVSGTRMVGAIAPLGRTGWYLTAETEHARAFAPAIAITNQIFIVDVCIILLFSVLAYKITVAIMQPIEALSLGALRISSGHVDYQIPLPANNDDELGLLTRTFNDMMGKLRSNQLEIEQDRLRLAEKNEELQRANEILSQLSITDGLTKLHNHRYFQDHLSREIKRVGRTKAPLSLILLDIDDFKQLNDTHGHAAGDEVLVSLAAIMNDSARESDLIARYGGEEFVILMPNTDLAGAVHLAEKIRMTVEETRLIIGDSMKPIEITISLGVALFDGHRREFFADADRALYQAKAAGKNCVIIAGSEHPPAR
jgi:diguanylate cyclase (GGDEF)-like protein